MRDNIGEKITLPELASACAVPERTLLRQFQRFLGVSPLAYLRRLRLNAARSELTRPGSNDPVSDIAIRCGFTHLGRFATEYRRLFNETPSATRRRVPAPAACAGANSAAFRPSRERPSLLILPLRTETLRESLDARDLSERLAATLSRMRIASVALVHPSHAHAMNTPQPRNAGMQFCLLGRLTQRGERLRVIVRLVDIAADQHVWGDCFDGSMNDPFELQDRVVDPEQLLPWDRISSLHGQSVGRGEGLAAQGPGGKSRWSLDPPQHVGPCLQNGRPGWRRTVS
jgi:AraC-like DNA-binding protein